MTSHHDVAVVVARLRTVDYFSDVLMASRSEADADLIDRLRAERKEAADLLESQAKALSEANDHIQQLQRALSFWMPGVTEASDIETNGRVADDAYLLMGYNGPISDDCWGDRTHKRALAAEARLADKEAELSIARQINHDLTNGITGTLQKDKIESLETFRAEAMKVIERLEWLCEQLASTRPQSVYDEMIAVGQAQTLLDLDNARRAARTFLNAQEKA